MINIKIVVSEKTTIEIQTDDADVVTKICESLMQVKEPSYTVSLDYMSNVDDYDTFYVSDDQDTTNQQLNVLWPHPKEENKKKSGCGNCGGCSNSKGNIYAD